MVEKSIITILAIMLIAICSAFGQTTLVGKITSNTGEPLIGAAIIIKGTQTGGIANNNGFYKIEKPPLGNQYLEVSYLGYEKQTIAVTIKANTENHLDAILNPVSEKLNEATVLGKSNEQIKREEPIKIEVINANEVHAQSISLPQLFNQVSGVKVRRNGGIGSGTVININGLQGNAIRFFRDGIPLDYLGNAFNLSLLPVDQISNIEIYKGVLPVELGADALGGAVNFISRKNTKNNLTSSYSFGSFNTHQATLNAYTAIPRTKLFTSFSSYYVYSDNNYKIWAEVIDDFTRNTKTTEVERFHGAAESKFIEFKTGIKETKIADLLEIGIALTDIEKERQHDFRMENVFGEVMYYEDAKIASTRYKKEIKKFDIDFFGAYSKLNTINDDTPDNQYDWPHKVTVNEDEVGESNESQSYKKMIFDNWILRGGLDYTINSEHTINFNHNFIYNERLGENSLKDPYANNDVDVLALPAKYARNITGLGITSMLFQNKTTNVFTVKSYKVATSSVAVAYEYFGTIPEVSDQSYGVGNSIKYSFNANRYLRISYEKATRIPDVNEYLGEPERDIMGNPELKPERSDNINLGFYSNMNKSKTFWIDINTFYRHVSNHIVLKSATPYQSRYQNTDDTRVLGGEFTIKAKPVPVLSCNLSLTYQDIRRKNIQDINDKLQLDARRPNIPYFFGNIGVRYQPEKPFISGYWQFYGNYAYVEQYLLSSIPKSEEPALFETADSDANIIPTQNIINAGITYKLENLPLWLNIAINNLLDADAYDGFRVQKPGRNFRVKLKYSIN